MGICALCGRKGAISTVLFESGKADREFKHKEKLGDGEIITVHGSCYTKRKDLVNRTRVYGNIPVLRQEDKAD